ncbi:MAG: hypothetical protein ABIU96_06265 [Rhodanobacter sp.]
MTNPHPPAAWPRPYWHPSDEQAVLHFYVFGKFPPELVIPSPRYGSPGLPAGVTIERFQNAVLRKWEGYPLAGELGAILREETPEAFEQSRIAPEVLVVRGNLPDAQTLDYLRDTLGVLAGLLDIGGTSIVDPQTLRLFAAPDWRAQYLIKGGAPARNHVLILHNADEEHAQRSWVRTRGMRKFGRPDISIHNVPERDVDRAGAFCEQLVELQSLGARFDPDQPLTVDGLPAGLVAKPGGDMSDPRFNNTHVEFRWPD